MGRNRLISYSVAVIILAGIGFAPAQGKNAQQDIYRNITDEQFLQEALNYSSFQIIMGEMAVKQAAGGDFRKYGKDMAAAHGQIYRDLEKIAREKGIRLTAVLDPVRRNTVRYYSQEYGAAFDRNYISLMVDENRRDAVLFRHMEKNSGDAEIRRFAGRVAPNLEGYASRAEKLLAELPFPWLK